MEKSFNMKRYINPVIIIMLLNIGCYKKITYHETLDLLNARTFINEKKAKLSYYAWNRIPIRKVNSVIIFFPNKNGLDGIKEDLKEFNNSDPAIWNDILNSHVVISFENIPKLLQGQKDYFSGICSQIYNYYGSPVKLFALFNKAGIRYSETFIASANSCLSGIIFLVKSRIKIGEELLMNIDKPIFLGLLEGNNDLLPPQAITNKQFSIKNYGDNYLPVFSKDIKYWLKRD